MKGVEKLMDFKGIYTEIERNKLIKKEFKRLSEFFNSLAEDKKVVLLNLFNEAAFMGVTLEETRKLIARDGVIEEYQNGANQKGIKKSAAVEVYDKMMNTYSKIIKQICDSLPEGNNSGQSAEEIMQFMIKGKS
jgi:hypothetical protein